MSAKLSLQTRVHGSQMLLYAYSGLWTLPMIRFIRWQYYQSVSINIYYENEQKKKKKLDLDTHKNYSDFVFWSILFDSLKYAITKINSFA